MPERVYFSEPGTPTAWWPMPAYIDYTELRSWLRHPRLTFWWWRHPQAPRNRAIP